MAFVVNYKSCDKQCDPGKPEWLNWLSVWLLVLDQVTISWFVRSSPVLGSTLTARGLSGILSLPLPDLCVHACTHAHSLKINK